jgi:hypothetical protein
MATLSVPIPDTRVAEATQAVAYEMQDHPDATIRAIAQKAAAGQATTAAEKQTLGARYCQDKMKQSYTNMKAAQAGDVARSTAAAEVW